VTEASGVGKHGGGNADRDRCADGHRHRQISPTYSQRSGRPRQVTTGYGTWTMTSGGAWTYNLDNNNSAVQALNAGDTLTDTFTVTTLDGTPQIVTITINGANDAAVLSADTVNLTETNSALSTGGTLTIQRRRQPRDLCDAGRHARSLRHLRDWGRWRLDLSRKLGA